MEEILQTIHDLEGVNGAIVVGGAGQLLGYKAHAVYDANLLQQMGKFVVGAVDSVKLIQEDWSAITAQFAEGKLLIRNLSGGDPTSAHTAILAVVADTRLNLSFAGVAVRVAVSKLKALLEGGGVLAPATNRHSSFEAQAATASQLHSGVPPVTSGLMAGASSGGGRPGSAEVATSGLSWSGLAGSSAMNSSSVHVTDAASSEFLTACTKALAKCVGPMAKLYVKEGVQKVCPDRPFSRDNGNELVAELVKHISNPNDAAQFRAHIQKNI
jgi:predicted regulator of Ras-like GTPase activity (Roadblock/LC7/MglB family)